VRPLAIAVSFLRHECARRDCRPTSQHPPQPLPTSQLELSCNTPSRQDDMIFKTLTSPSPTTFCRFIENRCRLLSVRNQSFACKPFYQRAHQLQLHRRYGEYSKATHVYINGSASTSFRLTYGVHFASKIASICRPLHLQSTAGFRRGRTQQQSSGQEWPGLGW